MVARRQVRRMLLGGVLGLVGLACVAIPPAFARSSVTVRTISFSAPLVALGVDQAAGVAVVAGGDKARRRVSLLDARTGAPRFGLTLTGVLWAPVEIGPASTLAIDEQNARAYVTTYAHIGRYGPTRGYVNVIDTQRGTLLIAVASPPASATGKSHLPGRPGLPVALTVDSRTGRLFVINSNLPSPRPTGSMTIIDARTGSTVGEVLRGQGPEPYAATTDPQTGHVFVVGQITDSRGAARAPAYLRLLDGSDGHILRTIALPHGGDEVALASHRARLILLGVPNTAGEVDYVTTVDTHNGTIVRAVPLASAPYATMAIDEAADRAFVAYSSGERDGGDYRAAVAVLDIRRGALRRIVPLWGLPTRIVVDTARAHVFVELQHADGTRTNNAPATIAMLDARSGAVLHTAVVGRNAGPVVVDGRAGRLFVAAAGPRATDYPFWPPEGNGNLSVLDTATGKVLARLPLGVDPTDIELAGQPGHVVVLSRGGYIPNRRSRQRWATHAAPGTVSLIGVVP
jgi:DNA-binding beta-propeller fold protein YncE